MELKNGLKLFKDVERVFFMLSLLVIILFGIYLRIKLYSYNFSFWNDEAALALNLVNHQTYLDTFKPHEYTQASPPFFMVISKFLLDISGQINNIITRPLILRLFPLLCGIISIPLSAYTVQTIFKNRYATLISTAILAFNDYAINYSQEFKQYEVELLFSIILLLIFSKLNFDNISNKKTLIYGGIFAIIPWFSFSSIFILIPMLLTLIFRKNKEKISLFFAPVSLSLFLFTIYYLNVYNINSKNMLSYWIAFNGFLTPENCLNMLKIKLFQFIPNFGGNIIFAIIAGFFVLPYKNNKTLACVILTPILLVIAASFLHKYPFVIRLILFLLPFFAIILADFSKILPKKKIITIILSLSLITLSIYEIQKPITKRDTKYSGSKDLFQILINENADIKNNVFTYTILGKYYLQPYENKNTDLNVQYEFIDPIERFKAHLQETVKGKTYYLFEPYYLFDKNGDNINTKMLNILEESKNIEVIDKHFDFKENIFLVKFKKK